MVIIGIAGLIIASLLRRKPVSPASEQSGISHPFTNVVGLSAPLINQGKTANPAPAQPENSNQLSKFQEAELPQQIKPNEEPAPEKAVDALKADQTRDLKASFKADSTVPQVQSTAATDNNVLSGAGGGADLSDDKPKVVKKFGNLVVELQSLKILRSGQYFLTMTLTNCSTSDSLWIALTTSRYGSSTKSLISPNGYQFGQTQARGIYFAQTSMQYGRPQYEAFNPATEIKPGDSTTVTFAFSSGESRPPSPGVCTLQLQFLLGNDFVMNCAKLSSTPNLVTKFEAK